MIKIKIGILQIDVLDVNNNSDHNFIILRSIWIPVRLIDTKDHINILGTMYIFLPMLFIKEVEGKTTLDYVK